MKIVDELKYYLSELESIKNNLEALEPYSIANSATEKIKTKISVEELSILFRLLQEEGIINTGTKIDLYRFIANNFFTEKAPSISELSVKNKSLTPSSAALINVEILLNNLKKRLKTF